ncbi:MAG: hypothetical protein ACOYO1_02625 [Bacteroidales bacterium]
MKKIAFCLMTTSLLLTVQPLLANTRTPITSQVENMAAESADVKILLLRIKEIKEMDKSDLKPSEKKELRKELREIKTELKVNESRGGGVYLSAGAIIIIILLLIILL